MRTLVVGILCGLAVTAHAERARGPVAAGCKSTVPANFDTLVERASTAAEKAYVNALKRKKLGPWSGRVVRTKAATSNQAHKPNEFRFSAEVNGIAPPVDVGGELVVDKKGVVYRVQREPQQTEKAARYLECGCGPRGKGTAVRFVDYVAELPEGTVFGGDVSIRYVDRTPTIGYSGSNANGAPCTPPP